MRAPLVPSHQVRPVIESVRPQVDGGRRPAKAAVGDTVVVEADVFADGHDVLTCDLRYRHDDDQQWSSVAMEPARQRPLAGRRSTVAIDGPVPLRSSKPGWIGS